MSSTPPAAPAPAWGHRGVSATPEAPQPQPPFGGSYPPGVGSASAAAPVWGAPSQQGSLAARLAEAEAARQKSAKEASLKEGATSLGRGKKASKQLVVLGMQNRRY